jgi:hypothetical protein
MYCYVWSFVVRPEYVKDFQRAYGPDGDWARLFRRDPQYIRTDLFRDRDNPTRFLTIDFWSSHEACVSFRARFGGDFEALDRSFERFTIEEVHVGNFDVLSEKA